MVFTKKQPQNSVLKSVGLEKKSPRTSRRSPARRQSPARTKSPSRASTRKSAERHVTVEIPLKSSTPKPAALTPRSPLRRSPSRKSPTRAVKEAQSPSRKSPMRTAKEPRKMRLEVAPLPLDSDSDAHEEDVQIFPEKPKATVRGRARRLEIQVERINLVTREKHDHDRIVHLKSLDSAVKKLGEFSDEDDTVNVWQSILSERRNEFKSITECGGTLGALLAFPALVTLSFGIMIFCNKSFCSFSRLPDFKKYALLSTYIHLPSLLGYCIFVIFITLLTVLLPFGGRKFQAMPTTRQGRFMYEMNGLFIYLITLSVLIIFEFQNLLIIEFVMNHTFHLLVAAYLFGHFLAILSYIHSFYVPFSSLNAHALTKSKIYQFVMGRELNPRFFKLLDLKVCLTRLFTVACPLVDDIYIFNMMGLSKTGLSNLELNWFNVRPTLITFFTIYKIYFLDLMIYESAMLTTFEFQSEGVGCMHTVGYLIVPFIMFSMKQYVDNYNIELPIWQLAATFTLFLVGLVLYRASNNQKDSFRRNPYDPALADLETIPTRKGNKLLCSGYWGFVRHPNYLGEILMNLSYIPFIATVPPVIFPIITILTLIHRTVRDNERCEQKYGSAWDRYCNKVKYVLLPKVY